MVLVENAQNSSSRAAVDHISLYTEDGHRYGGIVRKTGTVRSHSGSTMSRGVSVGTATRDAYQGTATRDTYQRSPQETYQRSLQGTYQRSLTRLPLDMTVRSGMDVKNVHGSGHRLSHTSATNEFKVNTYLYLF